jgi:HK97 family phage major capsid protein
MFEKRLQEIRSRKAEIRGLLESDNKEINLDELDNELRTLDEEQAGLEKRAAIAKGINEGTIVGNPVVIPTAEPQKRSVETMEIGELLKSSEYRSAYLKTLQGKALTDVEQRALTTAVGSSGAAVPTTTLDMIINKLRQTSVLFTKINVSYIPGNLSLVVANAKNAAAWKVEGVDGTAADDTIISVNLAGYELIKLVEISAASDAMTIDAFENYIAAEIGRQLAIALENAILNGTGSGQPMGIIPGVTWDATNSTTFPKTAGLDYDSLVNARALLGTMYRANGIWVMNAKSEAMMMKVKDTQGRPIFTQAPQDGFNGRILGNLYVVDDYVPDDTILFGCFDYYYMNFSKSPEIAADRSVSFKSGKITYRGLAVLDGKPALSEAFVKMTRSAV